MNDVREIGNGWWHAERSRPIAQNIGNGRKVHTSVWKAAATNASHIAIIICNNDFNNNNNNDKNNDTVR